MQNEVMVRVQEQIVSEVRSFLDENWDAFMKDFNAEFIRHDDPDKVFKKAISLKVMLQPNGPDNVTTTLSGGWSHSVKITHEPVEVTADIRLVNPAPVVE